jgi:hypothetical protein
VREEITGIQRFVAGGISVEVKQVHPPLIHDDLIGVKVAMQVAHRLRGEPPGLVPAASHQLLQAASPRRNQTADLGQPLVEHAQFVGKLV